MKGRGMFLSRTLSYRGAEFEVYEAPLTPQQKETYDTCALLWVEIKGAIEMSVGIIQENCILNEKEMKSLKLAMSQFWGAHQRFFALLCLSAKVPHVVRLAKQALSENKCVVIGLQSTGEARTKADLEENEFQHKFCSPAHSFLRHAVHALLLVGNEFEAKQDPIPELLSLKEELLVRVDSITLENNPLDALIDELGGPDRVAEMTGRALRIIKQPSGRIVLDHRTDEGINILERKRFQAGEKLVAIISDAASTGISLHADRRVKNQCRRVHITMELPWSADKAVQQLGRSHRSNQSSSPIFKLIVSDVGAEWRFASAVASRLEQLGALTQGDRRATAGNPGGMAEFSVDNPYGKEATKGLLENVTNLVEQGRAISSVVPAFVSPTYSLNQFATEAETALRGVGLFDKKKPTKVSTFLNRMFGVSIELQARIFRYFLDIYEACIAEARNNGTYEDGIVDCSGEKISVVNSECLFTEPDSGATVLAYQVKIDRGVSWGVAKQRYDEAVASGKQALFLQSKSPPFGFPKTSNTRVYSLAISREKGATSRRSTFYRVQQPASGYSPHDRCLADLQEKGVELTVAEMQPLWGEAYEKSAAGCAHYSCHESVPAECTYGKRTKIDVILTGAILGIWGTLTKAVFRSDHAKRVKIVRMLTDSGQRIVGLRIGTLSPSGVTERILESLKMEIRILITELKAKGLHESGMPLFLPPLEEKEQKEEQDMGGNEKALLQLEHGSWETQGYDIDASGLWEKLQVADPLGMYYAPGSLMSEGVGTSKESVVNGKDFFKVMMAQIQAATPTRKRQSSLPLFSSPLLKIQPIDLDNEFLEVRDESGGREQPKPNIDKEFESEHIATSNMKHASTTTMCEGDEDVVCIIPSKRKDIVGDASPEKRPKPTAVSIKTEQSENSRMASTKSKQPAPKRPEPLKTRKLGKLQLAPGDKKIQSSMESFFLRAAKPTNASCESQVDDDDEAPRNEGDFEPSAPFVTKLASPRQPAQTKLPVVVIAKREPSNNDNTADLPACNWGSKKTTPLRHQPVFEDDIDLSLPVSTTSVTLSIEKPGSHPLLPASKHSSPLTGSLPVIGESQWLPNDETVDNASQELSLIPKPSALLATQHNTTPAPLPLKSGAEWICNLCTFENMSSGIPSKDRCGMCDSRRPSTFKFQTRPQAELLLPELAQKNVGSVEEKKLQDRQNGPLEVSPRNETTYKLRQVNGPPLSQPILSFCIPLKHGHRRNADFVLEIGRSSSSTPTSPVSALPSVSVTASTCFWLDCVKGDPSFSRTLSSSSVQIKVGRGPTCDLIVSHPRVSRLHCSFSFREPFLFVQPEGLVTVDGVRVFGETKLLPGNRVGLVIPSESTTANEDALIEWLVENQTVHQLPLPDCKLQVSRKHCTLSYFSTSDTFTIRDNGSMNGTFVNRVMIARHLAIPVAVGAEILVGGPYSLSVGSKIRTPQEHVYGFILESG